MAGEVADKDVLDAAVAESGQAFEHYEIARSGTLIAWAESLGHDDIVRLLPQRREGCGQEALHRRGSQRRQSQSRKLIV